jgi:hypothetical protein
MNETLHEFVDSRGVAIRVDRQNGVIRGVKILGLSSRNGRAYLPQALAEAAGLYENAKVNVNHSRQGPAGPRDYQDRIGAIRGVTAGPEGLFADLHFNPKHALAEQLIWDAEHAPENVGFSHNVQARTSRRGDRVVVEAITKVESVDLVADPATTRGLFESAPAPPEEDLPADERHVGDCPDFRAAKMGLSPSETLPQLTIEDLKRHRPDLIEAIAAETRAKIAGLEAEIDRLHAAEAVHARHDLIRRLLGEFQLPAPQAAAGWARSVVSERFVESLVAAPDEETVRRLIEDRARLVRGGSMLGRGEGRPQSRDQSRLDAAAPTDARTFAQAIT